VDPDACGELRLRRWLAHPRALRWLERFGAPACLLSWLPIVGDALCAVAGWLRLPFWPRASTWQWASSGDTSS